jgi:membrane protein DedA with SNARE-associated domain
MVFSITELVVNFAQTGMAAVGIPGLILFMLAESMGVPLFPSEIILPFSGVLLYQGAVGFLGIPFDWATVLAAAVAGSLSGALLSYLIGNHYGMPFVKYVGRRVSIDEKDIEKAERFFERRGEVMIFFSRMLPLIRDYISYPAGAARMKLSRFSLFTFGGTLPFTLGLVYAGYVLGKNLSALDPYFTILDVIGVTIVVVLVVLFVRRKVQRSRASRESDH